VGIIKDLVELATAITGLITTIAMLKTKSDKGDK